MTPITRELLAPSLDTFGRSSTLPAEAYTAWSVLRWEQEHFFDRGWVCLGRAGGLEYAGYQRVVEWQGWLFANASGDAPRSRNTLAIWRIWSETTVARSSSSPTATTTR